jgi:hypothetical protein
MQTALVWLAAHGIDYDPRYVGMSHPVPPGLRNELVESLFPTLKRGVNQL